MRIRASSIAVLLAAVACAAPGAEAGTDTDQLRVTATVQTGCGLDGGSITFGQYIAGQSNDLEAIGEIKFVNCIGTLVIQLDGGASGNVNQRRMSSGSASLNYQIFRNSAYTAVWSFSPNHFVKSLFETQSGTVPVYGRIPGGQTVPSGTYSDTVNITMSF